MKIMEPNAKPSNGSLICTYRDCRFREEEYQDVVGDITGFKSTHPADCDWSGCHFEDVPASCECNISDGICPCGFRM